MTVKLILEGAIPLCIDLFCVKNESDESDT